MKFKQYMRDRKLIWVILCVVSIVMTAAIAGTYSSRNRLGDIVTIFDAKDLDSSDIKKAWSDETSDSILPWSIMRIEEWIRGIGKEERDSSGKTIPLPDGELKKEYAYGVIMVVTPLYSENVIVYEAPMGEASDECFEVLSETDIRENREWRDLVGTSGVQTTVRIEEVLYQTEETNYKAGDIVKVSEEYFILDQRTPRAYNDYTGQFGTRVVSPNGWLPMKTEETYLVYGHVRYMPPKYEIYHGVITLHRYNGVYCLSDSRQRASVVKQEEKYAEGIAYLKANYDLAKYGLK